MSSADLVQHTLGVAKPWLDHYGYLAVFGIVLVEGFGIPAPGQTLLMGAALLAASGELSLTPVLVVGWLGAVIGDNIGYTIGRFGGRPLVLRQGRRVGLRDAHLRRVEGVFRRYGGAVVVAARFFDILRQLNGVVAGTLEMPWWRFVTYNASGALLWVGVWGFGTFELGRHMGGALALLERLEPYAVVIGLVALAIALAYLFPVWLRNRR